MDKELNEYQAIVWVSDADRPGQRVMVLAENLITAKSALEKQYGEGNIFDFIEFNNMMNNPCYNNPTRA